MQKSKAVPAEPKLPKPRGAITLDRAELEAAGFAWEESDGRVTLYPRGIATNEQLECGRSFAASLNLSETETEELLEAGFTIGMWRAFRNAAES